MATMSAKDVSKGDAPASPTTPSKKKGLFGGGAKDKVLDQDLPKDDPFKPGSNKPQVDPVRKLGQKPKKYKEVIIGKRGIEPEVDVRVWLALGVRGMGVAGEEGIGSITQIPTQGEVTVKWDASELEHTYLVGRYSVHQLAVFDYMLEKEHMLHTYESNFRRTNSSKVKPPAIERAKELEVMLGYRADKQLVHRVSYAKAACCLQ